MKKVKAVLYLSIFLICLATGIILGWTIGEGQEDYSQNPISDLDITPIPNSLQYVILIVGVDDLSSTAGVMQSAWAAVYTPQWLQVSLTPLYPVESSIGTVYSQAHNPILVPTSDLNYFSNLGFLTRQIPAWDYVLILDSTAMSRLIGRTEISAGSQTTNTYLSMLSQIPKAWLDPQSALIAQARIVQYLCAHPKAFAGTASLENIIESLRTHFITNIPILDFQADWNIFNDDQYTLQCQFTRN